MIVVMRHDAASEDIAGVVRRIEDLGLRPNVDQGAERTVIGVRGPPAQMRPELFEGLPGVLNVLRVSVPHKLASREWRSADTVIEVGGVMIGGGELAIMAGPCAVESRESLAECARAARSSGAQILRGGAFKPRTSPYDFQGLGEEGARYLAEVGAELGMPTVSEARAVEHVEVLEKYVDIIQIGARNMQNYDLLRAAGRSSKPVLLKRGISAKIAELLMSAEYILAEGNEKVILCERGIRTFEDTVRFTLDVSAVPVLKTLTHLPVIVDPSHAAGQAKYVGALARAAVAAGADGVMIEVHPCPSKALCDSAQAYPAEDFSRLVGELNTIRTALRRT